MASKRGRRKRPGIGEWLNDQTLVGQVAAIVKARDVHNEETLTDVCLKLDGLARGTVLHRPLSNYERARLDKIACNAKPSEISRTLLSWRFNLSDRTVRYFQKHILEARWA